MLDDQVGRTIAAGDLWRAPNVYLSARCSLSAASLREEFDIPRRLSTGLAIYLKSLLGVLVDGRGRECISRI
jgi:hypothetical protein